MDGVRKLFTNAPVLEGTMRLGYAEPQIIPIGIALLLCTWLYAVPRTSLIGAVLLTGYRGGAVVSNVRAVAPAFNCAFPIRFSALFWGALWMRDQRLRGLPAR
jgi:hypothetical protein